MSMRRFVVAVAVLCLLAGQLVFAGVAVGADPSNFTATPLTPDTTYVGAKSSSGAIAQSDPALLGRKDSTPVHVMIKYDFDVASSYVGGVDGLKATSPRTTGKSLAQNAAAVKAYNAYTAGRSKDISARAQRAVPGMKIGTTFRTAYGGVSATLPANKIGALLKTPGVVAVQEDTLQHPLDDNTSFIGAAAVWPSLGGQVNAGTNVVVGVIDTGIWPEHPMMNDPGLPAPPKPLSSYRCDFGDGTDVAHLGSAFTCNNKLIGAYDETATYMANVGSDGQEFCNDTTGVCSARDSEGHGTHTATTAAGSQVSSAVLYGVQRGPISGIAPGAHVIAYRVCMAEGCYNSDSVRAVQQAILDGVNVINFSISGGAQPYSDPVELAFLDATNAGISVNASAGNAGPGAGTSDHAGPWVTTVGASTGPRSFTSTLHLTADGGATFDMPGFTLTDGISTPAPVVLAASIPGEDALCQSELGTGAATGKVVLCQRGGNARIDKGFNVSLGGAAGMVLYNAVKQDTETDNHWLPAIHVDGPSTALLAFVNGNTNVMASFAQGTPTATQADVMASFSSRGPSGDWIKPDITAPGIQVLAGMTPEPDQTTPTNGPSGNLYQAIAGTSMSSPHAAGVAALVKSAHPSWTPEEIKSALMTSSVQAVVKEDGVTPATPFDMGAGSIRANLAVNPTLVFNETYAGFVAAGTDPIHRIDLNIASIDATTMPGMITTKRTAINVSGKSQKLAVSTQAPAGVSIIISKQAPGPKGPVSVAKLNVGKHASLSFWVTISAPTVANGQYFGRITLTPEAAGSNPVTIPVAFVKTQGSVTLAHSCAPTTIVLKTGVAHCTATVSNIAPVTANSTLKVTNIDLPAGALLYTNISAPGTPIGTTGGVTWTGALSPALPPQVTSITTTTGPAGGYFPLSAFGIAPIAGVGDDTITNFNVPTFFYGGEPYTRIGVVSNGYVVIAGGNSGDIVYIPQQFPNANRPNNVIAPFWSDLNPPAGGAIRIATLTDGSTTWLVVDYDHVKNYGNATTHTGEVWFRLATGAAGTGPSSEQVTISYDAANAGAGDADSGINSGAENRDGTSGKNLTPADNTEYAVNTTGPATGGSVTITYDVSSRKAGTYRSQAAMTSDVTPGITQIQVPLTVTYP
jgi:subtilisin family serine protease